MNYIEIAGIKWATCNVGADKPTDTGLYFQWGDRKGYTADEVGKVKAFDVTNYKHHNGERYTKYNEFDGKHTLELCNDAAFAYMGRGWRMPTDEEFRRLYVHTTYRWTNNYQNSGVTGMVFTDITDKSKELFFPAVGRCLNSFVFGVGLCGFYWSGSLGPGDATKGSNLMFIIDAVYWRNLCARCSGFPIRGILKD